MTLATVTMMEEEMSERNKNSDRLRVESVHLPALDRTCSSHHQKHQDRIYHSCIEQPPDIPILSYVSSLVPLRLSKKQNENENENERAKKRPQKSYKQQIN
jgi:hypothetical protein